MRVRPMQRADLPDVASVGTAAFEHDEVFSWLMPRAAQYPDLFRRNRLFKAHQRFVSLGSVGIVAETTVRDEGWSGKPEVVGFAFYTRHGTDEAGRQWQRDDVWRKLERALMGWQISYESKVLDYATDMSRVIEFSRALDFDIALDPGSWHLETLAIHPKWQRRGAGKMLTQWGVDRSNEENVPFSTETSLVARKMYESLGFEVALRRKFIPEIEGIWMLREPDQSKGMWKSQLVGLK